MPLQLHIVDLLIGCSEKLRQPCGKCEKTKMRTSLEMHFPHQSPRKIGINPKAQMQPQLKERRIQDRQRRCHHKKPSQRLSNPGKVMVKERVRKERSPKGHLRRAKLSPLPKLRPRQNPKVADRALFILSKGYM